LIYSIQAAKPKFVSQGVREGGRSSLLFFGMIAQYSQLDYLTRMKSLLEDEDEVFEHMTIDLYNQGVVLKLKYDLLRKAYQVLLVGFVLSTILFILSIAWGQIAG
jgi:hypothetical protein